MINFASPSITQKEIKKVNEVMETGWITTGKLSREFGEKLAVQIGAKYCLPMSSCTAALHIALICAGVKEGDEVITTPMTFVATVNVIKYLGAIPVLVDIKPNDYIIDEDKIESVITKRTKAIIPVHFGGYSADLDKIRSIAKKYKLEVVEDAAHAYGSKYKNEYIGQNSKYACFSFYPTKNITTIEGGAFVTNDKAIYERACSIALHGISKDAWKRYTKEGSWRYDVVEIGYKYNMTDIQAAVGLVQLERIEELRNRRKEIYQYYVDNLENMKGVEVLSGNAYSDPFIHLFVIKLNPLVMSKDEFIARMKEKDIICSVHFIPVYHFSIYKREFAKVKEIFKVSEQAHNSCISLPFSSAMSISEAKVVIDAIKDLMSISPDIFLSKILSSPVFNVSELSSSIKYEKNAIYSYIAPYETGLPEKCAKVGFKYISSRVEMQKECSEKDTTKGRNNSPYKVSDSTKEQLSKADLKDLMNIGREIALTSRFYKDEQMPDKKKDIYDRWVENSFMHGYVNDYVLVREKTKIIGFTTIKDVDDLVIDLIGVCKEHRGKGVGRMMLEAIENKYPGRRLKVGTEAENVQAMNFYTKNGFQIVDYRLVFHKHT